MPSRMSGLQRLAKTKGKYGHVRYIERLPYIAVRKSDSMNICLIMEFVKNTTFDLCPEEIVAFYVEIVMRDLESE